MQNISITAPKGFMASGVSCGLKKDGNPDLALVYSETPAHYAGIYTTNLVKGHSLQRVIDIEKHKDTTHGVIINSGNANACVGSSGYQAANEMAAAAADCLQISSNDLLTCSTGVIGHPLPVEKIRKAAPDLTKGLSDSEKAGHAAMKAIMTTDLLPKEAVQMVSINKKDVTVAGMAKGSGMIHPRLATMISIVTTDVSMEGVLLKKALKEAAEISFHRITVDGDTSVCDTLLILANGASGVRIEKEDSPEYLIFLEALKNICLILAKKMAADGEGASKLIDVQVKRAATTADAYHILLAICRSPLCKTAFFGEDANWGRILTAAGYSGASFDPDKVDIYIGDLLVCQSGSGRPFDEKKAKEIMSAPEFSITVDLHGGNFSDHMWTCDFSYGYVKINGSYRS